MIGQPYSFLNQGYSKESDTLAFIFLSQGQEEVTPKLIEYYPIIRRGEQYYNLALTDLILDLVSGTFRKDDLAHTNNGDFRKVLYTVVSTITSFFEIHPRATVHIAGSDEQRIRVYRMLISRHWKEIEPIYYVKGFIDGSLEDFQDNKHYEFILISKK